MKIKQHLKALQFQYKCIMQRLRYQRSPLGRISLYPGDIAIDCGANVGHVTDLLAASGATVYAFEPNPHAFQILKERFANKPNVHCINKGVFDQDDVVRLYMHRNAYLDQVKWSGGSSLLPYKSNIDSQTFFEVDVVDLARYIQQLDADVRVVKMDVEGVEYEIINHLIETGVITKIEYLFVETHEKKTPELLEKAEALRNVIAEQGLSNIDLSWT